MFIIYKCLFYNQVVQTVKIQLSLQFTNVNHNIVYNFLQM